MGIKKSMSQKAKKRVAIFIDAANFEVSLRSLRVKADFGKIEDYSDIYTLGVNL